MLTKLKKRSEILERLTQGLQKWDGTSIDAEEIVGQNNLLITDLKQIDAESNQEYEAIQQKQVIKIVKYHKAMMAVIKKEQSELMEKMKQVNQKDNIAKNYYSSVKQSIFVDKGM